MSESGSSGSRGERAQTVGKFPALENLAGDHDQTGARALVAPGHEEIEPAIIRGEKPTEEDSGRYSFHRGDAPTIMDRINQARVEEAERAEAERLAKEEELRKAVLDYRAGDTESFSDADSPFKIKK